MMGMFINGKYMSEPEITEYINRITNERDVYFKNWERTTEENNMLRDVIKAFSESEENE